MPWEGKSMAVKFVLGKPIIFGKIIFCLWGKLSPRNWGPSHYLFMFFPTSRSWRSWDVFPSHFLHFLHFHGWENPFLYCPANGLQRAMIWGFEEVVFSLRMPIDIFWKSNFSPRVVFPFSNSFLVPRMFLLDPTLVFVVVCIHVLVWKN